MTTKTQIENALQAWAKATAGVEAVWTRQKVKVPVPGLTLHLDGPKTLSPVPERWHVHTPSNEMPAEAPQALDPGTPGQEITYSARDNELWSLQIQARAASGTGEADATALLVKLKNSLKLMGTLATLRASAITVADVGDVQDVSTVIETDWQDRAVMTLLLWTADVSTEQGTFIESVEGQGQDGLAPTTL